VSPVVRASAILLITSLRFRVRIMYMWFEAFPLAYGDIYGFNLGVSSLPFLVFVVASVPTVSFSFVLRLRAPNIMFGGWTRLLRPPHFPHSSHTIITTRSTSSKLEFATIPTSRRSIVSKWRSSRVGLSPSACSSSAGRLGRRFTGAYLITSSSNPRLSMQLDANDET
jgi:hypothetical protein